MLLGLLSKAISFLMPTRFIWYIIFVWGWLQVLSFPCKEPRWASSPSSPLCTFSSKMLQWAGKLWKMVRSPWGSVSALPLGPHCGWRWPWLCLPEEDDAEVWSLAQHPCQHVHTAGLYFRVQGSSSMGPVDVSGETSGGHTAKSSSSFPSIKRLF